MHWIEIKKPIIALAAMDGVTDCSFREICHELGSDVQFTEFIHSRGLFESQKYRDPILEHSESEKPIVVQLYGNNAPDFYKATIYCLSKGFDGIDINMGCPSKNVSQHGSGCALMRNSPEASKIVKAVIQARDELHMNCPVTVKMRIGYDEINAVEFAQMLEQSGAQGLIVHGRTLKQSYSGFANWSVIEDVIKNVSIPVMGNGDVDSTTKVKRALNIGCVGVTIGRASIGNPWIFEQIKKELQGETYTQPTFEERKEVVLKHALSEFKLKGDHGIIEMRKHFSSYFKGFDGASEYRSRLYQTKTYEDLIAILKEK